MNKQITYVDEYYTFPSWNNYRNGKRGKTRIIYRKFRYKLQAALIRAHRSNGKKIECCDCKKHIEAKEKVRNSHGSLKNGSIVIIKSPSHRINLLRGDVVVFCYDCYEYHQLRHKKIIEKYRYVSSFLSENKITSSNDLLTNGIRLKGSYGSKNK